MKISQTLACQSTGTVCAEPAGNEKSLGYFAWGAALSMVKSIELLSRWQSTAHTLVLLCIVSTKTPVASYSRELVLIYL